MPFLDDGAVFVDFILLLAFGGQVLRVDAFHADEDLSATGFGGQRDEVFRLARQIDLHHEGDVESLIAQLDDFFKGLAPEFFTGEVVVGEKIKR